MEKNKPTLGKCSLCGNENIPKKATLCMRCMVELRRMGLG